MVQDKLAPALTPHMDIEKTALLFGPYNTPALKVGDRSLCLYRDAEVVIYDWTIAPMSWALCYHAGTRAFGKGILVEEELRARSGKSLRWLSATGGASAP